MGDIALSDLIDPDAEARLRALAAGTPAAEPADESKGVDELVDVATGDLEVKDASSDQIEHKASPIGGGTQVLEADSETGRVVALVSVTGVEDRVKDIIEPGAYTKTMATREPIGVWSHDDKTWVARTENAVELMPGDPFLLGLKTMDGQPWPKEAGAVKVEAQFNLETPHGKAAFSDVKFFQGKTGWSIGYRATKAHRNMRTGVRHIKELDWFEYSPVMVGAASQPMTLAVKSLAQPVDADDDHGLVDDELLASLDPAEVKAYLDLRAGLGLPEFKGVRDYIRDADGQFASSGQRDSQGGKDGGGKDLPADPDAYKVDSVDAVRAFMRNWTRVPRAARGELKKRMQAYLAKVTDGDERNRLRSLVDGLGDGDGKREAGEGAGAAHAAGRGGEWLDRHKSDDDLEVKDMVRTPEGARRFGQPIGTKIVRDRVAANALEVGDLVDFKLPGAGGDGETVKGHVDRVERDGDNVKVTVDGKPHKLGGSWPIDIQRAEGPGGVGGAGAESSSAEAVKARLEGLPEGGTVKVNDDRGSAERIFTRQGDKMVATDGREVAIDKLAGPLFTISSRGGKLEFGDGGGSGGSGPLSEAERERLVELDTMVAKPGSRPTDAELMERSALHKRLSAKPAAAAKPAAKPAGGGLPAGWVKSSSTTHVGPQGKVNSPVMGPDKGTFTALQKNGARVGKFDTLEEAIAALAGKGPESGQGYTSVPKPKPKSSAAEPRADADRARRETPSGRAAAAADPPYTGQGLNTPRKPKPSAADRAGGGTAAENAAGVIDSLRTDGKDTDQTSELQGLLDDYEKDPSKANADALADALADVKESDDPDRVDAVVEELRGAKAPKAAAPKAGGAADRAAAAQARTAKPAGPKPQVTGRKDVDTAWANDEHAAVVTLPGESAEDGYITELPPVSKLAARIERLFPDKADAPTDPFELMEELDLATDGDDDAAMTLLAERITKAVAMAYGGRGLKSADINDLEAKRSSASLDRSPKANWVERAGDLPAYIREVARAIHEDSGKPLDQAIPIAIGRIKKWAAGVGNVSAAVRAKAQKAAAEWEALKAKSHMKHDSELLAHIEYKTLTMIAEVDAAWDTLASYGEVKALFDEFGFSTAVEEPVETKAAEPVGDELVDVSELVNRALEVKAAVR